MDSSTGQNNKGKNVGLSVFAGVGYAVGGFIVGTIITGIIIYFLFQIGGDMCFESCFFVILVFSPMVGLVAALLAGIVGGRRTFKRLSERQ